MIVYHSKDLAKICCLTGCCDPSNVSVLVRSRVWKDAPHLDCLRGLREFIIVRSSLHPPDRPSDDALALGLPTAAAAAAVVIFCCCRLLLFCSFLPLWNKKKQPRGKYLCRRRQGTYTETPGFQEGNQQPAGRQGNRV